MLALREWLRRLLGFLGLGRADAELDEEELVRRLKSEFDAEEVS